MHIYGITDWFKDILGIPSFDLSESPRDVLIEDLFVWLFKEEDYRQVIESSYDSIRYFIWFSAALVFVEIVYRLMRGALSDQVPIRAELKEILISAVWVFALIPQMPLLMNFIRLFFNAIGRGYMTLLYGDMTPAEIADQVGEMTGSGPIDLFLSLIQLVSLFAIIVGMGVMIVAFAMSVVILILGMAVRWIGVFGANALRVSITLALFSAAINMIMLVIIGGMSAIGRGLFPDSQFWRGVINTAAFVAAAWVIKVMFDGFGAKIRQTANAASQGYAKFRRRPQGSLREDPDGEIKQRRSAQAGHDRQVAAMGSDNNPRRGVRTETVPVQSSERRQGSLSETDTSTTETTQSPPRYRRLTSTAARSVRTRVSSGPRTSQQHQQNVMPRPNQSPVHEAQPPSPTSGKGKELNAQQQQHVMSSPPNERG